MKVPEEVLSDQGKELGEDRRGWWEVDPDMVWASPAIIVAGVTVCWCLIMVAFPCAVRVLVDGDEYSEEGAAELD